MYNTGSLFLTTYICNKRQEYQTKPGTNLLNNMAGRGAARPNAKALWVPQRVVDKVNESRPLCFIYKRTGGCKKGALCPQRHESNTTPQHAARMSFAYNNDGNLDLFFTTVYGVASFGRRNNSVLFRNDGNFNFSFQSKRFTILK